MNRRSALTSVLAVAVLLPLFAGLDPCLVRVLAGDRAMACSMIGAAQAAPHACCAKAARAHAARGGRGRSQACCEFDGLATSSFTQVIAVSAPAPASAAQPAAAPAPACPAAEVLRVAGFVTDESPPGRLAPARHDGRAPPRL